MRRDKLQCNNLTEYQRYRDQGSFTNENIVVIKGVDCDEFTGVTRVTRPGYLSWYDVWQNGNFLYGTETMRDAVSKLCGLEKGAHV